MSTQRGCTLDANLVPVFGSSTSDSLWLMFGFLPGRKQSRPGSLDSHYPKAATPHHAIVNQQREAAKLEIPYGCLFLNDGKSDGKDQGRCCEELASGPGG